MAKSGYDLEIITPDGLAGRIFTAEQHHALLWKDRLEQLGLRIDLHQTDSPPIPNAVFTAAGTEDFFLIPRDAQRQFIVERLAHVEARPEAQANPIDIDGEEGYQQEFETGSVQYLIRDGMVEIHAVSYLPKL